MPRTTKAELEERLEAAQEENAILKRRLKEERTKNAELRVELGTRPLPQPKVVPLPYRPYEVTCETSPPYRPWAWPLTEGSFLGDEQPQGLQE